MPDTVGPQGWQKKDNEFVAWYPLGLTEEAAKTVWQPRPAGYYVHIPYCTAICDYCGFAVERIKSGDPGRYVRALREEIIRYADSGRLSRHEFICGHFGGGTPSTLPPEDLVGIKRLLDERALVGPAAEITVEVNPISFSQRHAETYRDAGINRISIGVQSFDDQILRLIGRPHRQGDVTALIDVVHHAKIENFSLDIIYGVPGQSTDQLRNDLAQAADSGAAHLTCFRLEIIPYTNLKLREVSGQLPSRLTDEQLNEMDEVVTEVLTGYGYCRYGAFNFARPGFESVHNRVAFVAPQADYIGFGNSSYSFVDGNIYCNHAAVPRYIAEVEAGRDPIAFAHRSTALELMSRYFVLGVKFHRVPRKGFIDAFGLTPEDVFGPVLNDLADRDMLRRENDEYVLTARGVQYVNNVCKSFYVGENRGRTQYAQFVPTLTPTQLRKYTQIVNGRPAGGAAGAGDTVPRVPNIK
jgi:oxygen-independent coproporphyrinogen-3 oxidase